MCVSTLMPQRLGNRGAGRSQQLGSSCQTRWQASIFTCQATLPVGKATRKWLPTGAENIWIEQKWLHPKDSLRSLQKANFRPKRRQVFLFGCFFFFFLFSLTMGACFPQQLLPQKHGSSSVSSNCISEATPREMPSTWIFPSICPQVPC